MHNPFPCVRSLTSSRLHPFPPFQPPRSMLILFVVARASGLTVGKWAAATQQRKLCEASRSNFEVGGTGGGIFLNVVVLDNRVVIFLPSSVVSASRSLTQKRPKRNPKRKQMYTPNLHQRTHSPVIAAAVLGHNRRNEKNRTRKHVTRCALSKLRWEEGVRNSTNYFSILDDSSRGWTPI